MSSYSEVDSNEVYEHNEGEQMSSSRSDSSENSPQHKTLKIGPELREYFRGKPFMTVNSIHTFLRENCSNRISRKASAALVGVMQGLLMDLLKEIVEYMQDNKIKRISPKIISMVIQTDSEIARLLSNVLIPESGIYGNIQQLPDDMFDIDDDDDE